jgi:Ca2+-binding EF-hand superfamily protein
MSHGDWHKALRAVSKDKQVLRVAKLADADMRALRTKLRLRFKKESYTAKGADLKALFQRMDKDGSGELDLPEFAAAVRRFGIMDEQELQALVNSMDDDGNGTIDVGEFMEFVEGEEEQTLEDIAKAAVEQERARKYAERKATMKPGEWGGGLRAGGGGAAGSPALRRKSPLTEPQLRALRMKLRRRLKADSYTGKGANMEALFQRMDKDGSGELSSMEMKAALRKWGIVDAVELSALVSYMDTDGSGWIDILEFCGFITGTVVAVVVVVVVAVVAAAAAVVAAAAAAAAAATVAVVVLGGMAGWNGHGGGV